MGRKHLEQLRNLVDSARTAGRTTTVPGLDGFSGDKMIGLLQRLAAAQSSGGHGCYAEIGVFRGLTLISVAAAIQPGMAHGIDNFAQFDHDHRNQSIIQQKLDDLGLTNVGLINADYEDALNQLAFYTHGKKIGTFFVDGPHDYRSQLMCLELIQPHLSSTGVIIVDDANYRHVRLATHDFLITHPEFKLLFEAYTARHPGNMSPADLGEARRGWWNGVHVIVRDPENELQRLLPKTVRDRTLYENEHLVHSHRLGVLAPEALDLLDDMLSLRPVRAARKLIRIVRKKRAIPALLVGEYRNMNTFSELLEEARIADMLPGEDA